MDHVKNAYDSLKHYFGVLEQAGIYSKSETSGLLLYCFIVDQVFEGPLSEYLDDEGLMAFNKALRCLYKNGCLIVNPDTIRITDPQNRGLSSVLRITERRIQRETEESEFRRTE